MTFIYQRVYPDFYDDQKRYTFTWAQFRDTFIPNQDPHFFDICEVKF